MFKKNLVQIEEKGIPGSTFFKFDEYDFNETYICELDDFFQEKPKVLANLDEYREVIQIIDKCKKQNGM